MDDQIREEGVEVPWDEVDPATLRRLVEEFVTREGTDYGREVGLDQKVEDVLAQLRRGEAIVSVDLTSESITIVPRR